MSLSLGSLSTLVSKFAGLFNRKSVGTALVVSVLSTAMVVAAVRSDGSAATNVRLDDGSVWVTNTQTQAVGRLNVEIDQLDFSVSAAANGDVIQDGRTVLFSGAQGGVQRLDVLSGTPSGDNEIPIASYQARGGIGLVVDSTTGALWVGPANSLVAPDYPDEPDALLAEGSIVVVTEPKADRVDASGQPRGKVLVVEPSGWFELELDGSYEPVREPLEEDLGADGDDAEADDADSVPATQVGKVPLDEDSAVADDEPEPPAPIRSPDISPLGVGFADVVAATAVGDELVLLLADGQVMVPGSGPVQVPGDDAVLQQVGPEAETAVVASTDGLFRYPLGGDQLTPLVGADGALPAAPVRVGPCVYGAWAGGTPSSIRVCDNGDSSGLSPIAQAIAGSELIWRVNQRNVALNSPGNGGVWADHEGALAYVGNWADVEDLSTDSEEEDQSSGESLRVTESICLPGGEEPPIAGDDQLGVRPRQSIIDVLNNDDDINCEPIAVVEVQPASGLWGQLTVIDNGQHVLYSPSDLQNEEARERISQFSFSYVIEDSSGNRSSAANVSVRVQDLSLGNVPPELRPKSDGSSREMRTVVEEGRTVSYDALADWWDPDGDDIRLVSAEAETRGEVSSTPDGIVRFSAFGVSAGVVKVRVRMSDGVSETTESLEVTVKPSGSPIPPVTSNDFITLVEGATGVVFPLANDSDPNEDPLELRPLWLTDEAEAEEPGFRTAINGAAVEISALAAGTYRLRYEATDGVESTEASIRLVIVEPGAVNRAPVAVPDQIKLRVDRVINVDVLANDVDGDGDLLAVTDVSVTSIEPELGVVRASIVDRRLVQIEVLAGTGTEPPTGPFTVNYQVTDGFAAQRAVEQTVEESTAESLQSLGAITVLIQPPSDDQPPVVANDSATVRSGDIVSIPVLRNDTDPDSDPIVLASIDAEQSAQMEAAGEGVAWIEGRNIFFQGGIPGRRALLYTVTAAGKPATGEVSIEVKPPPDIETNPNQPPSPPDLVLRAVRNGEVRLRTPLFDVDPDGDSVFVVPEFTGLEGAADGNRVSVDPDDPQVVIFAAGALSGPTDTFNYTVQDPFGERGTAVVEVMVLDDGGWAPQAHDDVFRGKPGRTLSIPVLANDSSPSDRRLEIAELPFFDLEGQPTGLPVNHESVTLLDQTDVDARGRIDIVVPTDGTTLTEHYRISDGRNPGDAFVRVTPDPDAPNVPPVANLDIVELDDVFGLTEATVGVLDNDFDPDDAGAQLKVSIPDNQNATVSGGIVTVPLDEAPQKVLYRAADADGATTVGIIEIPGLENHPPTLSEAGRNPNLRRIEAGSPAPITVLLADILEDPDGDEPLLLTPRVVSVLGDLGEVTRIGDQGTGFVFTPPPNLQQSVTIGIQFEVTDRPEKPPEEQQLENCHCLALLTVELVIDASSPPRILSQGAVSVPQLDEEVSYELAGLVIDDQGDALAFQLDNSTFGGLDVSLAGSTMTLVSNLAEDEKIPVGTAIPIRYTVADQKFDPVEGTVVVTMIATNKGQPATGSFPTLEAERDFPIDTPNLIDTASNPFPDRPLTLVNSTVDGGASLTCDEAGNCEFSSEDVGSFTVGYTIKDAVDQTANGTLDVVVKGKPRAPGVPAIESVGDHVVNLSWSAADMQGAEFVTYHVTAVEAGVTKEFTSTGGEFDGLTNGDTYHFTVRAENELGDGEESDASSPAIPDRVPDRPVKPVFIDYVDAGLELQWEPPPTAGDFTPILYYEVSIGGESHLVDGSTTTLVVGAGGPGEPLLNGTPYSFTVRAQNSATTNNGWGRESVVSALEHPSRYPDPPTGVVGVNSGDGGQPRLTVTWNAPGFDGGRGIDSYRVCMVEEPANCQTVGGSSRQTTFVIQRGLTRSFTVIAFNGDKNRNNSDPSAPSAPVTPVGNPDAPVISSVTTGDKQLTVIASTANNSGCSSILIEYSRDGGANFQASATFTGLTNGTQYSFVARATLGSNCGTAGQTYQSGLSNSVTQTPYGPLQTPTISAEVSGERIRWHWDTNRADDGRPGWSANLSSTTGGTGCSSATLSSSTNATGATSWKTIGYSTTGGCQIAVIASGASPITRQASATTGQRPLTFAFTRGGTGMNGSGTTPGAGMTWINLRITGLAPGSYTVLNVWDSYNPTVNVGGDGVLSIGDGWRFCGAGPVLRVSLTVDGVDRSAQWTCT